MGRKSQTKARLTGNGSRSAEQQSKSRVTQPQSGENFQRQDDIDNAAKSAGTTDMTSSSEVEGDETNVLPTWLCWVVVVWSLISRLWYVTTPTNWWILHPDEVYQTVEVAHTEAFGYGFRPYEYLPPPGNVTYSAEHARTSRMGMYSLRSYLLVKVIAAVMLAAERCGVMASPFLVIKVFHVIVTSCLPLAVYRFSRALYKSGDVATMSAIFTGFSLSLNVLGTHTLINSFLSPLVFVAMVPLVCALTNAERVNLVQIQGANIDAQMRSPSATHKARSQKPFGNGDSVNINNSYHSKTNGHTTQRDGQSNGHCVANEHVNTGQVSNGHVGNGHVMNGYPPSKVHLTNNGHANGHIASQSVTNSNDVAHGQSNGRFTFNSRKSPESKANYNQSKQAMYSPSALIHLGKNTLKVDHALLGMLLGMCVYTRPDTILIPLVISIFFITNILKNIYSILCELSGYALGVVSGMLIGGYVDHVTYGVWFISVKQWFNFNIRNGYSAAVFGEQPSWFYIDAFANLEPLAVLGCAVLLLDMVITCVFRVKCKSKRVWYNNNSSLILLILLFIYSLIGHKEYRFFHNGIVLFYIAIARSICNIYRYYLNYVNTQNGQPSYGKVICLVLTLICSRNMYSFYNMDGDTTSQWAHGGMVDADVNICMDFLHGQTDVKGVFTDRPMFQFTGYSSFHKDVPVFVASLNDFMEYDRKITSKDAVFFSHNLQPGFSTFGRISDFMSASNVPYIANVLINKPIYNYKVISSNRQFLEIGFKEVFRTETVKVLKRTFVKQDEAKLNQIAKRTAMGTNATVLEYEGEWLKHYGVYKKAEERLLMANKIDDKRIGPYQLLMEIFLLFNNVQNYNSVLKSCMVKHPVTECKKAYVSVQMDAIHMYK